MRRIAFTLIGVAALVLCGNQMAMAHGYGHGGFHHSAGRYAYPHYWGGGYGGGYGGYGLGYGGYGVGYGGGYGCGTGYAGYGAPYGYSYGYPQPGFGVSVPNFSMWVR